MRSPGSYQEALAARKAAESALAAWKLKDARARGAPPLLIELLEAQSNLATLDAKQAADRLASSTSCPEGACSA